MTDWGKVADRWEMTIEGAKELDAKLQSFEKKLARKIIRKAVKEGAEVNLKAVQELAPVLTGALKESLEIKTKSSKKYGTMTASVVTSKKTLEADAFYSGWVNWGTRFFEGSYFVNKGAERSRKEVIASTMAKLRAGVQAVANGK